MDHSNVAVIYGPGIWFSIHTLARNCVDKKEFLNFLELVKATFPCVQCRAHFEEYYRTHPIGKYWTYYENIGGIKEDIGLYKWTWEFHNAVNQRLGKLLLTWDIAKDMYKKGSIIGICMENCDQGDRSVSKIPPLKYHISNSYNSNSYNSNSRDENKNRDEYKNSVNNSRDEYKNTTFNNKKHHYHPK